MAVKLSNNATSTLAASINATATTISVVSGDAARFPALTAGDWFPVTVVDSAGNMEIMRCTARSGATLTVARAQEGTTGKAFAAGSRIEVRLTAAVIEDVRVALGNELAAALALKLNLTGGTISGDLVVNGDNGVDARRGYTGSYGSSAGSGGNWGANLWAIGNAYDGVGYGTSYVITGHYGLSWLRSTHVSARAEVGEGLYHTVGGVIYAGMGNAGIWTSGNVTAYSVRRVKANLEPVSDALAKVLMLTGYTYHRIGTGARQLGVAAQEVQEVFPELVTGDTSAWSVAYGNFAGVFIEAIKELNSQLEALRAEVAELRKAV